MVHVLSYQSVKVGPLVRVLQFGPWFYGSMLPVRESVMVSVLTTKTFK